MEIKKAIYDIIFSYNDGELLEKRINFLKGSVDYFIVLNFSDSVSVVQDRVITIQIDKPYKEFSGEDFNKIYLDLDSKFKFRPEDIFLFSKTYEIPSSENLSESYKLLSVYPICINHSFFLWDTSKISIKKSVGTKIFNHHHFRVSPNIFQKLVSKEILWSNSYEKFNSGWDVSTLCTLEEFFQRKNFWGIDCSDEDVLQSFQTPYDFEGRKQVDYEKTEIPYFLKTIKPFSSVRDKKTFIINFIQSGDTDTIEIFTNDKSHNLIHTVNYPKRILYGNGSYDLFKKKYYKNEILKPLSKMRLIDDDEIHIKINSELVSSEFKYFDLLKNSPSELF